MKIAFTIFKYFPHGGLQLDFWRIAAECIRRGHDVTVCAGSWEGEMLPGLKLVNVPVRGWSNHAKALSFERNALALLEKNRPDVICGMNRMAGLDVYFAADNCFAAENGVKAGRLKRLLSGRYNVYESMEKAVLDPSVSHAAVLLLTERQREDYRRIYGTPDERFVLLPPGIDRERRRPEDENEVSRRRERIRREFGVDQDAVLLIQICSSFGTKGLDRTIAAVAALPENVRSRTYLLVAGREKPGRYRTAAEKNGIGAQVIFAGGRSDIGDLLSAADLMVHPARKEATGTVLAEALAGGVPVITSGCCGYAFMVRGSGGTVLGEPFDAGELANELRRIVSDGDILQDMKKRAAEYGRNADFYRRAEIAADVIERIGAGREKKDNE